MNVGAVHDGASVGADTDSIRGQFMQANAGWVRMRGGPAAFHSGRYAAFRRVAVEDILMENPGRLRDNAGAICGWRSSTAFRPDEDGRRP